jgi:hypothetical protein
MADPIYGAGDKLGGGKMTGEELKALNVIVKNQGDPSVLNTVMQLNAEMDIDLRKLEDQIKARTDPKAYMEDFKKKKEARIAAYKKRQILDLEELAKQGLTSVELSHYLMQLANANKMSEQLIMNAAGQGIQGINTAFASVAPNAPGGVPNSHMGLSPSAAVKKAKKSARGRGRGKPRRK